MSILKIRDADGNEQEVLAIRGEPGHTPERGIDYWTEADKDEVVADVLAEVGTGGGGGGDTTALREEIGNPEQAKYLFPKCTSIIEGMYYADGDHIAQEGCYIYGYHISYPELLDVVNRKLYIKTYMYGDMALCHEDYVGGTYTYTNENADIVANPESGIFEIELDMPCDVWSGATWYVSFCENPYMDKPEVCVKTTLWEEMNHKASKGDIEETKLLVDDCWVNIDCIVGDVESLYEEIDSLNARVDEELEAHLTDTDNPHNVMYEQIYDEYGMDLGYRIALEIGDFLTPSFDKNGLCQNIIESSNNVISEFRIYKTITLSQQTPTEYYFPFQVEAYGNPTMLYFQANVISDMDYNTRVVTYTPDYSVEDDCVWGISICLASDIPAGQTTKATIAAHFYMTGF